MEKILTYEDAFNELQDIAHDIESENVLVDTLARKVKRASELISYCQDKLRLAEKEVNNIISQMDKKN
jgi:exodeoxyribonuclease VII small subunit